MEKIKITKILSTILVVMLLFNVFLPCFNFAAYKQDGQDKYNVLRVSNITKSTSGNYVFYVEYAAIAERYEAVPLQSEQVYCPYAKVVVHATYMFKDEKSLNDFASECNK